MELLGKQMSLLAQRRKELIKKEKQIILAPQDSQLSYMLFVEFDYLSSLSVTSYLILTLELKGVKTEESHEVRKIH